MKQGGGRNIQRRTWTTWLAGVLAASTLAACGGDSEGAGPDNALSQAEAAVVMSMLLSVYTPSPSTPSPVQAGGNGSARVPTVTLIADTTQNSAACPAGGAVLVLNADSIRVVTDTRLNPHPDTLFATNSSWGGRTEVETRYQGCATRDSQGNVWTFDATPGLTFGIDLSGDIDLARLLTGATLSTSSVSWDGLWAGAFSWTNGSRSGQCTVSVQMMSATTVVGGAASSTYSYVGQMCGLPVSVTS
ncbi:MAG: hypothetical protein R3E10_17865 [Gemmatimonadota bacterium]